MYQDPSALVMNETVVTAKIASTTMEQFEELEAALQTMMKRLNFGPDLDPEGMLALKKVDRALSLVEVAIELYEEAEEIINES